MNSSTGSLQSGPTFSADSPNEVAVDYPSYEFLVELHTHLMRDRWHETYYGPTRPVLL